MKKDEFYIGQRVKKRELITGYYYFGHVKKITDNSVIINWDDPNWPVTQSVEHFESEYDSIKNGIHTRLPF